MIDPKSPKCKRVNQRIKSAFMFTFVSLQQSLIIEEEALSICKEYQYAPYPPLKPARLAPGYSGFLCATDRETPYATTLAASNSRCPVHHGRHQFRDCCLLCLPPHAFQATPSLLWSAPGSSRLGIADHAPPCLPVGAQRADGLARAESTVRRGVLPRTRRAQAARPYGSCAETGS
jgi:hypothetical protein